MEIFVNKYIRKNLARTLLAGGIALGGVSACDSRATSEPVIQDLTQLAQTPCDFLGEVVTTIGYPEYLDQHNETGYGYVYDFGKGKFEPGLTLVNVASYRLHVSDDITSPSIEMFEETGGARISGVPIPSEGVVYDKKLKAEGTMIQEDPENEGACALKLSNVEILSEE